jgi:hypothetical protein
MVEAGTFEPTAQPRSTLGKVHLQRAALHGVAVAAAPIQRQQGLISRRPCSGQVSLAMFALFGQLDPGHPGKGPRRRCEAAPRDARLRVATASAKETGELHRGERNVGIAAVDWPARNLQTSDRLIDAAVVAEEARQSDQVSGRGPSPNLTLAVATFYVGQDAP